MDPPVISSDESGNSVHIFITEDITNHPIMPPFQIHIAWPHNQVTVLIDLSVTPPTEPTSQNHTAGGEKLSPEPVDTVLSSSTTDNHPSPSIPTPSSTPDLARSFSPPHSRHGDDNPSVKNLYSPSEDPFLHVVPSTSSTSPPSPATAPYRLWDANGMNVAKLLYYQNKSIAFIQVKLANFGWLVSEDKIRDCLN